MPVFMEKDREVEVDLDIAQLSKQIAQVKHGISSVTGKYQFAGILIRFDGKTMDVCSCDARRMAITSIPAEGDLNSSLMVASKTVGLIQKMMEGAAGLIAFAATKTQIKLKLEREGGNFVLCSNLIEGSFPPYREHTPKDHPIIVRMSKVLLTSALKRAGLLASQETKGVRMVFDPESKVLTLSSRTPERGTGSVTCPIEEYTGAAIEIGFVPQFLLQAIEALQASDRVTMEMLSEKAPCVIQEPGFIAVVTTINLA